MILVGIILVFVFGRDALSRPVAGRIDQEIGSPSAVGDNTLNSDLRPRRSNPTHAVVAWDATANDPHHELAVVMVGNLLGHFGEVSFVDAATITTETATGSDLVVYVSAGENSPISTDLIRWTSDGGPTLWLGGGLDQIATLAPDYFDRLGWSVGAPNSGLLAVDYRGTSLPRDQRAGDLPAVTASAGTEVLATATDSARSSLAAPYALRFDNLTWLAEAPFAYTTEADRGLVLADTLFDLLAPEHDERHRGMVRLEDVGPTANPAALRRISDELTARDVPFSIAVYPVWMDPRGRYNEGHAIRLADRPEVVAALEYMKSAGGTVIMHGVTHQLGDGPNPYHGASGEDFEFYVAHVDDDDNVVLDGPPAIADSAWTSDRIVWGLAEFADAGLDRPTVFEFPHYAAHWESYVGIEDMFDARYERTMYFGGLLRGEPNHRVADDQWYPYPVVDFYGELVLPENMGNYIEVGYNNHSSRGVDELVAISRRLGVVRDSVASLFFHPYLDPEPLLDVVDAMLADGVEFVSPSQLILEMNS
ncbi:MAG: DUF2334 domain-containing protein [Actinomycetia bacterium]|nr:DUF2334 domain-containing protein [Actinomycetes bacterium]MCP4958084.1 DUF2334 domain-containing protein [Actinomycetes bacterium]